MGIIPATEKKEALVNNLWNGLINDPVFNGEWAGVGAKTETEWIYSVVTEHQKRAREELDNFNKSCVLLVKFLEEGGF